MIRNKTVFVLCVYATSCMFVGLASSTYANTARGTVFHDQNANGERDEREPGIAGVRVSNGLDIVETDDQGRFELPIDDDTIVFVIKPRDWRSPTNAQNLPQFYYIHKPAGSPDEEFAFSGVEPTGPLPESIDFPLTPSEESDEFCIILMGDPQPYNRREIRYYANDLIAELVDANVAFGISLGDIVGNKLSLFKYVNDVQAKVGVPWYNVIGNHDQNYAAPSDKYADETFERVYGPTNFAFQWASVHFIVLDNVRWKGAVDRNDDGKPDEGNYEGGLSESQLNFVANYVAGVPTSDCIVICTHIPLANPDGVHHSTPELPKLLDILAKHPHQLSFSAHTHYIRQDFVGGENDLHTEHAIAAGGAENHEHHHHHHFQLHHHNTATGSGSWYRGPKDEQGLPMTPMRDGVPNGYLIAKFTGGDYKLRFKAARMPADYQMSIHAPATIPTSKTGSTEILVNVFNGNDKSALKMRVRGTSDWIAMEKTKREDPAYRAFYDRDQADKDRPHKALPLPVVTPHIWAAMLPADISPGVHILEVQSTDMFNHVDRGIRLIEVDPDPPAEKVKIDADGNPNSATTLSTK